MKQKINVRLVGIAILAIFVTSICLTLVYYELFQERVKADLMVNARLLSEASVTSLMENENVISEDEIRITWISKEGEVLFDNDADVGTLANHMDRPEVKDAFEKGMGEADRRSDTMNMRNFYCAVLLEDGTVLRVATEARSILSVFLSSFPVILFILVIVVGFCVILSRMLTKQLIEPISEMADYPDTSGEVVYEELTPFMDRIREQHENILASARSRQDFTANVSHELKTPITAISGYAELIENEMVDKEQQIKFAGAIRQNADRLVSVINDTIKLSELDHGVSAVEFTKMDIYEAAKDRVELLKGSAKGNNITIELKGSKTIVTSRPDLFVELFDNLVQNAIRYNVTGGRVEITIESKGSRGILIVKDTGIGIPKREQERVFERFYRVDKSRSRETGGTGLGLAIVKHIVELHSGSITLNSDVGKGTIITVEI